MMAKAFDRIVVTHKTSLTTARIEIGQSNPLGRKVQPQNTSALMDFFCSARSQIYTNIDLQINSGAD